MKLTRQQLQQIDNRVNRMLENAAFIPDAQIDGDDIEKRAVKKTLRIIEKSHHARVAERVKLLKDIQAAKTIADIKKILERIVKL